MSCSVLVAFDLMAAWLSSRSSDELLLISVVVVVVVVGVEFATVFPPGADLKLKCTKRVLSVYRLCMQ